MRKANRLASEKSPYLLQHAHNPVDWFPWGEEAFAAARERDVPIFLSIGYATCHWCHVMERESFENEAVAEVLNAGFVSIKVDREERPDVDRLYMTSMQAMRMGGGWPLNVFLTPDLVPFFGGTYIPPTARGGRSGMLELLPRVSEAWATQRDELIDQGHSVLTAVGALAAPDGEAVAHDALVREGVAALTRAYDPDEGGFGSAPKFPSTVNLALLLAWWARAPRAHEDALVMVRRQLDAMRAGGIHDHLGGGFHRYSTDAEWLVPHFEKMLYDQALIGESYLDAFAATGEPAYADTARGVFDYVARDLTSPEGAFYSAEDADSEGEEGRFYVWTPDAITSALSADEATLVSRHWNVTARGNFEHGATILHERASLADSARSLGLAPEVAAATLERARAKLLAVRATRPRPLRDDKVLAAWNGLMIAALAKGAVVLGEPGLAARAARAAAFVDTQLRDRDRNLARRWREGEAAGAGQLDDHAYLAYGMLALWDATHEPRWLERAIALTEAMLARFWDEKDGACFESPAGDPSVLVRMKDGFDGAEMAGNSIAADNLVRLAALLDREDWREKSRRLLEYYARRLAGNAWAMPRLLVALERAGRAPRHVVIAGEPGPARDALVAAFHARGRPGAELILVGAANREALARLVPFAAAQQPLDGRATAFVCEDYTCRLPVTDPSVLAAQLDESAPAGANEEHA